MSITPTVLIITGPTASGKTQLSDMIAASCPSEIINADVGQFYKPLSIGTAKPDLANVKYQHHMFDLLDKPQDLSVAKYRSLVIDIVKDVSSRRKTPIIVGGSLFYIKSLFFPAFEFSGFESKTQCPESIELKSLSSRQQWELLQKIDPERATELHPNDSYRINRALDIWFQTGTKPSLYKPQFDPAFNALIVYVQPDLITLKERICLRTELMLQPEANNGFGWIEESEKLIGTEWEEFLKVKNLIGYTEIFDWIKTGKSKFKLPELINIIQIKTVQYAKRQRTFWGSFQRQLFEAVDSVRELKPSELMTCKTMSVERPNDQNLRQILTTWDIFPKK